MTGSKDFSDIADIAGFKQSVEVDYPELQPALLGFKRFTHLRQAVIRTVL